jgi:methionine synthase I (cobalamin-dependent)
MSYAQIAAKLRCDEVIILDGGTGTDIQRRGAPMSGDTWCADVNLTHPDIVRAVHRDYIQAGAEIITANTFATSPIVFGRIGRANDVARIDAVAVALAREAAAGTNACVAGSMSTMRPVEAGTDRNDLSYVLNEYDARALFRAKANGLKAGGCAIPTTRSGRVKRRSIQDCRCGSACPPSAVGMGDCWAGAGTIVILMT